MSRCGSDADVCSSALLISAILGCGRTEPPLNSLSEFARPALASLEQSPKVLDSIGVDTSIHILDSVIDNRVLEINSLVSAPFIGHNGSARSNVLVCYSPEGGM